MVKVTKKPILKVLKNLKAASKNYVYALFSAIFLLHGSIRTVKEHLIIFL